ncbi:hypothetical protein [Lacipirellula sp.]|uniref:hypothetical protein n=1 Tax=Lacipirellula sp. TaxID=2691419 RepID=UPI003D151AC3
MFDFFTRVYVAFSLVAVGAGLAAAWADGDHLLASDDPYIVGFLLGGVAGALTALHLALNKLQTRSDSTHLAQIIYFLVLFLWAAFWLAADCYAVEGKGIGLMIALASGVTGVVVWLLGRFPLPTMATRAIGLLGVSFIASYAYVAMRLAQSAN